MWPRRRRRGDHVKFKFIFCSESVPVPREERLVRPVQRDMGLVRQEEEPEPRFRAAVEGALAIINSLASI